MTIYLIGGIPRSGKTILAGTLSRKIGCPYISVDNLRAFLVPYIPKKDHSKKLPFEAMYFLDNDNDLFFKKYSAEEMIKADLAESRTLWTGVRKFINHQILSQRDFIIEGVQLLPRFVHTLKKERYWPKIKTIYLTRLDPEKILDGIKKNTQSNDWLLHYTKKEETLEKAANMLAQFGTYFSKEANKYEFPVFNTEHDFHGTLEKAAMFLTNNGK